MHQGLQILLHYDLGVFHPIFNVYMHHLLCNAYLIFDSLNDAYPMSPHNNILCLLCAPVPLVQLPRHALISMGILFAIDVIPLRISLKVASHNDSM